METKDSIQKDPEKKWHGTLLKYLSAIIIIFVLLVSLGVYEDPLDVSSVVVVLVVITFIALMAGALRVRLGYLL